MPTPFRSSFLVSKCKALPGTVLTAAGQWPCDGVGLQLLSIPGSPRSQPCAEPAVPTALPEGLSPGSWLRRKAAQTRSVNRVRKKESGHVRILPNAPKLHAVYEQTV